MITNEFKGISLIVFDKWLITHLTLCSKESRILSLVAWFAFRLLIIEILRITANIDYMHQIMLLIDPSNSLATSNYLGLRQWSVNFLLLHRYDFTFRFYKYFIIIRLINIKKVQNSL